MYQTQWGSGDGQFDSVGGMVTDDAYVYVADNSNNRIQKFDKAGNYVAQWGSSASCSAGSGKGQFNGPAGIAVDGTGNVYAADYYNNRLQKFIYATAP